MAKPSDKNLTEEEMLARMPKKNILSTREVRHVLGGVHEVTIYKWVKAGELTAYTIKARGRANVFRKDNVIAFIRRRFALKLKQPDDTPRGDHGSSDRLGGSVRKPGSGK